MQQQINIYELKMLEYLLYIINNCYTYYKYVTTI